MKPPDRPGPGRTDRILGVMGGMLRACALPGQEGVRRETKVGSGSLAPQALPHPHPSISKAEGWPMPVSMLFLGPARTQT